MNTVHETGWCLRTVLPGKSSEICASGTDSSDLDRHRAAMAETGGRLRADAAAAVAVPFGLTAHEQSSRADLMRSAELAARTVHPAVTSVNVQWAETLQRGYVATEDASPRRFARHNILVRIDVHARKNGEAAHAWEAVGCASIDDLDVSHVCDQARRAAIRAVGLLDAVEVRRMDGDVVFAPGTGGVLFHEACGHLLENDNLQRGNPLASLHGQSVAIEQLSLADYAAAPGGWYQSDIDDEGQSSFKVRLIDHGVLAGLLHDRAGGICDNTASCNGRRSDYASKPMPRMTNTFIEAGNDNPSDILEDTRSGIMAVRLGGGQVNPATGNFMFEIAEGYEINRGKIGAMIKGAVVLGNAVSTLASVDAVGNDLVMAPAICGKAGQALAVGIGQPTIRVRNLAVAGNSMRKRAAGEGTK